MNKVGLFFLGMVFVYANIGAMQDNDKGKACSSTAALQDDDNDKVTGEPLDLLADFQSPDKKAENNDERVLSLRRAIQSLSIADSDGEDEKDSMMANYMDTVEIALQKETMQLMKHMFEVRFLEEQLKEELGQEEFDLNALLNAKTVHQIDELLDDGISELGKLGNDLDTHQRQMIKITTGNFAMKVVKKELEKKVKRLRKAGLSVENHKGSATSSTGFPH